MISEDYILTKEELDAIDFRIFSSIPLTFHEHEIGDHLNSLAESSISPSEQKLVRLISLLFSFNLQTIGGCSVFEPRVIFGNRRTLLPDDFDTKLNDYLIDLSNIINNPFLLSRICDVVWTNNKSNRAVGVKAIESYASMIDDAVCFLKGRQFQKNAPELDLFIFIKEYIERALFISSCIYPRKSNGNAHLIASLNSLYKTQSDLQIFEGFNYLTWVMMRVGVEANRLDYATKAQCMAEAHSGEKYFDAVKVLYNTSARIYEKCGCKDKARECMLSAAKITVDLAKGYTEPNLKASWLRTAISELRQVGGENETVTDLKQQLADLREEVMCSFVTLSTEIDISEEVNNSLAMLTKHSMAEIFTYILSQTPIENINTMKEDVERVLSQSFFSSFFASELYDEDGRRIYTSKPVKDSSRITDDEVIDNYLKNIAVNHDVFINAVFEPARLVLAQEHNITYNTFQKLSANSPVVKPEIRDVLSLGFYRLWQGDYIGATYLLIPQLEGILRYAYEVSGKDSTRFLDKGLEESTSISILLDKCREDIEQIFSKDLTLTIDLIFNKKNGPALRHRLAHGNLYSGYCFSSSTIYACVLIFYICAYPLHPYFEKIFEEIPKH